MNEAVEAHMAKMGDAVCPFTGGKFAAVEDGVDGTKIVRTPIFREPITLTRELFEDLPGYPARLKLGLRRWIADRIDRGESLETLTSERAVDQLNHPPPSLETKAYRLLGWMVRERIGPRNPARKFEFGVDRVTPNHEACLVTESEDREKLLDALQLLQALGYVEYLGARDQVVTEPRLTIRLTDAGRENGGRPPPVTVNQASTRRKSDDRLSAQRVTQDSSPAEVERIVIRTVSRELVRERIIDHGPDLVAMADQLLAQFDKSLAPVQAWPSNEPSVSIENPELRAVVAALQVELRDFRDALATAVAAPRHPVKPLIKQGGRLVGQLKAACDHKVGERLILGLSGVGVAALASAAGVPVDPNITLGLMVAGPEGAKAVGDAIRTIGGLGT